MNFRHLPLLLLLTALTAQADGQRLPYACTDGSRLDLVFSTPADGRPQAAVHVADRVVNLPQVPAAVGALYRAGEIRLYTDGDDARFDDGQGHSRHCRRGDTPPGGSTPAAATSSFLDIAGSVAYRAGQALPADAQLVVRIQDDSRRPARVLAEQRIELAGQPGPVPFATTIDRDLLGKKARVTVSARIERRGKALWVSERAYPALLNGQPQAVDLQLRQVGRAPAR